MARGRRQRPRWICHACEELRPYAGFDKRRKICARCQADAGERPDPQQFAASLVAGFDRVPTWIVRLVVKSLGA